MTNSDKKILAECCRVVLIKEADKKFENDKIDLNQFIKLEKKIVGISDNNILKMFFQEAKIPELEPEEHKAMKYSAALVGGSMAANKLKDLKFMGKALKDTKYGKKLEGIHELTGAAIAAIALFIFRKAMNPCFRQAALKVKGGLRERQIHFHQCQANACKKVIASLVPKLSTCAAAKNPSRCHRDIEKVLDHWKEKYHQETLKVAKLQTASA